MQYILSFITQITDNEIRESDYRYCEMPYIF